MTKDERRVVQASAAIRARYRATMDACDRVDAALEVSSGVPMRELSEDDSLATSIDDARREQELVLKSDRSRRVMRFAARVVHGV